MWWNGPTVMLECCSSPPQETYLCVAAFLNPRLVQLHTERPAGCKRFSIKDSVINLSVAVGSDDQIAPSLGWTIWKHKLKCSDPPTPSLKMLQGAACFSICAFRLHHSICRVVRFQALFRFLWQVLTGKLSPFSLERTLCLHSAFYETCVESLLPLLFKHSVLF